MGCFVFRSPRLGFLAASPALARPVAAFYHRNQAAFAPFEAVREDAYFTPAGQAEQLAADLAQAEQDMRYRFYAVQPRHPGKVIGMFCLDCVIRGAFQSCFISYKTDSTLWGQGYGTEGIQALSDWGFANLRLHRIEANIMPRNLSSRRAAAKAGFSEEGLSKHYLKINGVWEDHIHMVRLNEEEEL